MPGMSESEIVGLVFAMGKPVQAGLAVVGAISVWLGVVAVLCRRGELRRRQEHESDAESIAAGLTEPVAVEHLRMPEAKREREAIDVTAANDACRQYLGGSAIEVHERYEGQAQILVGDAVLPADVTFRDWSELLDARTGTYVYLVRGLRKWDGAYSVGNDALDGLPEAELLLPSGRRGKILVTLSYGDGTGCFVGTGSPPTLANPIVKGTP